ncbi:NUDIX hydrolase [Nocardia stercoris]|uniref:NUDIX hydrolase n=1 Tax=Nocardia stercoris TaxID=2483361 RepID=A0A3M2KU17_9NOCA|nr:NUDIX hydrolase [Nocardia stercoris]
MSEYWRLTSMRNPTLFNGPLVRSHGVSWESDSCVVSWSRSNYAHYLWRHAPGNSPDRPYARAVYVSVVARTDDGSLVLGRMATETSSPGRIQLPGGNVVPPITDDDLTEDAVRRHAACEFREEVGVELDPEALRLWAIKVGGAGDIGVFYLADLGSAELLRRAFDEHIAQHDGPPEFTSLITVHSGIPGIPLIGPQVDYLPALLQMLFGTPLVPGTEFTPRGVRHV